MFCFKFKYIDKKKYAPTSQNREQTPWYYTAREDEWKTFNKQQTGRLHQFFLSMVFPLGRLVHSSIKIPARVNTVYFTSREDDCKATDIHQIMLISLFPTPFDHIHFHGSAGLVPQLILTPCHRQIPSLFKPHLPALMI